MLRNPPAPEPADVSTRFPIPAPLTGIETLGGGLINDTFLVSAGESGWVLQRINGKVFADPELIMANLALLSEHLEALPQQDLRIPRLLPAADGRPCVRDRDGGVWRLMELIPHARVLARLDTISQAREVGRCLGRFHRLTFDLDPERLATTLSGFHCTPEYLQRLDQAVESGGDASRDEDVRQAIDFVASRRHLTEVLEQGKRDGRLSLRVVHGDPKLDNILFDQTGERALGLIDLDTVQPGLVLQDIGDCLRSCCNRGGETRAGAPQAEFDTTICRGILEAYASESRGLLSATEIGLIYDATRLLPFELGLRFLTDHLEGDPYFRVSAPGDNLRKALVQFDLVADVERKEPEIRRIILECWGPAGA
jgi:Ser/Thr protein kinase RdoA (MazF antagonist)